MRYRAKCAEPGCWSWETSSYAGAELSAADHRLGFPDHQTSVAPITRARNLVDAEPEEAADAVAEVS